MFFQRPFVFISGSTPGTHILHSMFPSLDTDLRWIPEDFEETGDDLVESSLPTVGAVQPLGDSLLVLTACLAGTKGWSDHGPQQWAC